jgi:transposase
MSIHLNEQPSKSWSEKGKQFINETKNKCILGKRYSLCMSIDTHKNINYILKENSIKGDDFNSFIKRIKNNKKPILMDNAKIHHSKLFKKNIKENKINVIYNIPYFSKYNPIEYIFSLLRKEIENNNCNSEKEIINVIEEF